jgi:large subunit ribosomal protein L21
MAFLLRPLRRVCSTLTTAAAPIPLPPLRVPHNAALAATTHKIEGAASRFAVLQTGGKQYKVTVGDVIVAEKLPGDVGSALELHDVLLVGSADETVVGRPSIPGALVKATVEEQTLAEKELVFKKKRRKNYRRMHGHRQEITVMRINEIVLDESQL